MVKDIAIEDYNYVLPDDRIALHPLAKRDTCKLLLSSPSGKIYQRRFSELPGLLPLGSLMVCNDTKVINARMEFHKDTGARIELFLLEPVMPSDYALMFQSQGKCVWKCLVGNLKKWKDNDLSMSLRFPDADDIVKITARKVKNTPDNSVVIEFSWTPAELSFATIAEAAGEIPIPPYLNRKSELSDRHDYQTVYADAKGSVAAPTAGLHFTRNVFEDLEAHNIKVDKLTLHVGAGTFQPVKSSTIGDHPMHSEVFTISRELIESLIIQKKSGMPVVAVGTTTVRTLESLPLLARNISVGKRDFHVGQWEAYDNPLSLHTEDYLEDLKNYMERESLDRLTASTSIMIAPGFDWKMTDVLVTNFHQPKSTLLLLVSSFINKKTPDKFSDSENERQWRKIYEEALKNDYRFLSYGDACLLFPATT